jgi:hypothetical protein
VFQLEHSSGRMTERWQRRAALPQTSGAMLMVLVLLPVLASATDAGADMAANTAAYNETVTEHDAHGEPLGDMFPMLLLR